MHRRRLEVLDSYELIGSPVVTATRLAYVPWVEDAVRPYNATRLPVGPAQGLTVALRKARLAAAALSASPVEAA
ncbi:MAG: hypothetical protein ABL966_08115 [Acidimicrobiales bacterium]